MSVTVGRTVSYTTSGVLAVTAVTLLGSRETVALIDDSAWEVVKVSLLVVVDVGVTEDCPKLVTEEVERLVSVVTGPKSSVVVVLIGDAMDDFTDSLVPVVDIV